MGVYGPSGAVETASFTDQVGGIGHFDAIPVLRHPALNLMQGLFVFGNAKSRNDKHPVGLEPVDICPTVFGEMLDIVIELMYHLEVGLQDVTEPCCHFGIELMIVRHYDGFIVHKAYYTICVAIDFIRVPRKDDEFGREMVFKEAG